MIELLMDVTFVVDICLNFFTAYVKTEECLLVIDRKVAPSKMGQPNLCALSSRFRRPQLIANNYLKKWFPIDVAGSLPMDLVFFIIDVVNGEASIGGCGGDSWRVDLNPRNSLKSPVRCIVVLCRRRRWRHLLLAVG